MVGMREHYFVSDEKFDNLMLTVIWSLLRRYYAFFFFKTQILFNVMFYSISGLTLCKGH